MVVWQLAGGPATRPYADIFLRYGVGLIGPGDAGSWGSERSDDEFDGGFVRRFASEMQVGDVVLLRTGIATIAAVGLVASDDVVVSDGIRYRMYSGETGFEPVAYANLIRLKRSAADLFDRMKRP